MPAVGVEPTAYQSPHCCALCIQTNHYAMKHWYSIYAVHMQTLHLYFTYGFYISYIRHAQSVHVYYHFVCVLHDCVCGLFLYGLHVQTKHVIQYMCSTIAYVDSFGSSVSISETISLVKIRVQNIMGKSDDSDRSHLSLTPEGMDC